MHTGETLAAAPPARPLRQSRLGGLSLFLALAGVAIALAVMALALGERIDLSDENHLLGLFAALLAVFAVSTCGLVLGLAGLLAAQPQASPGPGRHRPQPVVPALGLACAEHGGGRDPDGPGANRVVVPQRPGGAVRHDLLPPGLTRSATVRRQPGRPRFGRSFIGLPDCSHSSRICRGGAQPGKEGARGAKVSPGGADLRGSCGTVVRAPGRDQRWKG
ncbi:hypothetical protein P4193_16845 [Pseudomonas aeruginosa]|nr:hypothetical protein [Pseudomonas aeruginosa]